MYSIENLEISGYRSEPVPHTFFKQDTEVSHLAILLPGWNYTCQMPLLYYSARLLLSSGADVLQVEYAYNVLTEFQQLSRSEQLKWLFNDSAAACKAALEQRPYQRITLVGKSLGTLAMGHLFATSDKLSQARAIWLTPLLRNEDLRAQIKSWGQRSLFVIGTADPNFNSANLAEVKEVTKGETVVIEGANHSLEIENDILQSLNALEKVISAVQAFVV